MSKSARSFVAALLCAFSVEAAAADGALEEGSEAYRQQDYAKAAELWRGLADKGDAEAQYRLGTLYAEGKGVGQNDATAMTWFLRAADKGNALAQYNAGASYAAGLGVAKSEADAAKWFKRAADQGMPYAQLNLGLMYAAGNGVPQDNTEAMKWLQLALFGLPAGGVRSDVARAIEDVSQKMTSDELREVKLRVRAFKPKPEAK
ncbi:MAG TPA: tetratricopeptide repeat protein [Casimicrobiaceae bacterium]|nr:tetratricopeptide repeat protein [Casimicrobiaceae bacterium]